MGNVRAVQYKPCLRASPAASFQNSSGKGERRG